MKKWLLQTIYIVVLGYSLQLNGVLLLDGDITTTNKTQTFTSAVVSKVYDRATGTLYMGIDSAAATGVTTNTYCLSKTGRYNGTATQTFTPIGLMPPIQGNSIEFLALPTESGTPASELAVVLKALNSSGLAIDLSQTTLLMATLDGKNFPGYNTPVITMFPQTINPTTGLAVPANINDASGTIGLDGITTSGIVGLAANSDFIFAAVRPGGGLNFGTPNSGIALITQNTVQATVKKLLVSQLTLEQVAAVPADPGIKAQKIDPTTPQIWIGVSNSPTIASNVVLNWDSQLGRLYIGLQVTTGATTGNGAKSVVVAQPDNDGSSEEFGALNLINIVGNDAAFIAGNQTNIVGTVTNSSTPFNVSANFVRVMHASTGPSYLIVHGGNGLVSPPGSGTVGNTVYALPLVDVQDPTDLTQGTLADITSFDSDTGTFVTQATTNAGLITSANPAAQVGAGPLPIMANDTLSDFVVVGDTIYVSTQAGIPIAPGPVNQGPDFRAGIYYSQALFDNEGKISRWTPWSKRAIIFDAFPVLTPAQKGFVWRFEVDAVNGKLFAVDYSTGQTVVTSNWEAGTSLLTVDLTLTSYWTGISPLTAALSGSSLTKGCFSVLDLDANTRGLGAQAPGRYALFGGMNTVVFTLVSQSTATVAPFNNVPEIVSFTNPSIQPPVNQFATPQFFLETSIPTTSGVKVLEFSRNLTAEGATNYFFAGADDGLFVFANSGAGFTMGSTINTLDLFPFATGSWQKILSIPGSVIDIKTSGLSLYILTLETSSNAPMVSKIYNIPFAPTVAAMFASSNINLIAQSQTTVAGSDLGAVQIILGMQIISTGAPGTPANKEQLVIATNVGLYKSDANQTGSLIGIPQAGNQAAAFWAPAIMNDTTMYYNITGIDTPIRQTIWPISILDQNNQLTFSRGGIKQLSGTGNTGGTAPMIGNFDPINFHSNDPTNLNFNTFDAITNFWSDGARRFFTVYRQQDDSNVRRLLVSPYNITEWSIVDPRAQVLVDSFLQTRKLFFWAKQIGATGIFMVGTEKGIVALE